MGCATTTSSSSTRTTSASTSSSTTRCSACASSTPRCGRWSSRAASTPPQVFCSGANIQMLAGSTHAHKVNFCKFTNETRNSIEDATAHSGQVWIAAVNGTAAGGGYELALACDEIVLVDDRSSTVSLPEVPLLGGAAGHGWSDPRGRQAPRAARPRRRLRHTGRGRQGSPSGRVEARRLRPRRAARSPSTSPSAPPSVPPDRIGRRAATGIVLAPLDRSIDGDTISYPNVDVLIDRELGAAHITVRAPSTPQPITPDELMLGRQRRVDPRRRPRARRRDAAPAVQRDRGRDVGAPHRRRHRRGAGRRVAAVGRGRRLARPRGVVVLDPHAEASRPVGAHDHRPRRARQLLRRDRSPSWRWRPIAPTCSTGRGTTPTTPTSRSPAGRVAALRREHRSAPDVERAVTPADPLLRRRRRARRRARLGRQGAARRRVGRGRPRDVHARRHRLGRRDPARARGAQQLLARRADRHGGQPPLRRAGDDGDQDLLAPVGVAELDLPATERGRPRRSAPALRHRIPSHLRPQRTGV